MNTYMYVLYCSLIIPKESGILIHIKIGPRVASSSFSASDDNGENGVSATATMDVSGPMRRHGGLQYMLIEISRSGGSK